MVRLMGALPVTAAARRGPAAALPDARSVHQGVAPAAIAPVAEVGLGVVAFRAWSRGCVLPRSVLWLRLGSCPVGVPGCTWGGGSSPGFLRSCSPPSRWDAGYRSGMRNRATPASADARRSVSGKVSAITAGITGTCRMAARVSARAEARRRSLRSAVMETSKRA